jgi:lysophospholipase L1-like esterase
MWSGGRKKANLWMGVFLAAGLCLTGSSEALAHGGPKVPHLVALGDSLSVGWEPESKEYYGYADRLYEQMLYKGRVEYLNYALGGLTSEGLRNFLQAVVEERQAKKEEIQKRLPDERVETYLEDPAEIKHELKLSDLVMITIGGNDFWDYPTWVRGKSAEEVQAETEKRLASYRENVTKALELLFTLSPRAKVYIADQFQPIPEIVDRELYLHLGNATRQFARMLDEVIKPFQEKGHVIEAVHVADAFVGHELEYTHIGDGMGTKPDIHPNQQGYDRMARLFAEQMFGEYKQPAFVDPVGVIVKGRELETMYKPHVIEGTTYLPVREYAEALGFEVVWEEEKQTAHVIRDGKALPFVLGEDGVHLMYDQSKLYVPIRKLVEGLGLEIVWREASKTIFINQ